MARIGIVSDVHCDHASLALALDALAVQADEVWCAGDIVLQYRFCNHTTRLLREANVVAIKGNHDLVLVSDDGRAAQQAEGVDQAEVAWLAGLPLDHRAEFDGVSVLMTHGSPWAPHGDYLSARNEKWNRADELGVDVLVTGHTHVPMAMTFGRTLVVNPGSLGEPRGPLDRRKSYAVVDTATRAVTTHYVT